MDKNAQKNWLSFSRKERTALLVLAILVGLFFLLPYFFPKKESIFAANDTTLNLSKTETNKNASGELFFFDPNTIDSLGWRKLGLREKTTQTILHYREKGGRFRKAEDIRKIYGLKKEDADRLLPFIQIENGKTTQFAAISKPSNTSTQYNFPLEINKAGEGHWAALPGISPGLARRIVHFRDAMHGFKNVDQVGKTYGLSAQAFARIKPLLRLTSEDATTEVRPVSLAELSEKQTVATISNKISQEEKININTASEQELLSQKRIPKSVAKAIVIYREQHGAYQQVADIKNIVFINEDVFARVAPYLRID